MPKSKPQAALNPRAGSDLRRVPGNTRRRIIVEIDNLEHNPRPSNSKRLSLENDAREIRRLRIGLWRVIYFLQDEQPIIPGIRKRPPYDYDDLDMLAEEAQ
jgi:mRNA-degrading endonuclease RelE of RelBE toxin-antitoxin system